MEQLLSNMTTNYSKYSEGEETYMLGYLRRVKGKYIGLVTRLFEGLEGKFVGDYRRVCKGENGI